MTYPGQDYFHRHNANIRRAEERWMVEHGAHLAIEQPKLLETDQVVSFLEIPLPPHEIYEIVWRAYEASQGLTMKSNDSEATLRKGSMPKSSTVTTVDKDANKGKCAELASANVDGNPKKRTCNTWGIKTPSCKQ